MNFISPFRSENQSLNSSNVDEEVMSTPSITKCIFPTSETGSRSSVQNSPYDFRLCQNDTEMERSREDSSEFEDGPEAQSAEVVDDEAERQRKMKEDEEASERLAWELMQQEQNDLYNMQLQYIQEQAASMSEDDFRALQQVLGVPPARAGAVADQNNAHDPEDGENAAIEEEEAEDGEGEEEADNEDDNEAWDYDRLLALGQALGDVKTERWRLKSQQVIDSLPVMTYRRATQRLDGFVEIDLTTPPPPSQTAPAGSLVTPPPHKKTCLREGPSTEPATPSSAGRDRCSVCMEPFQDADLVAVLPCRHCFHPPCAAGWIRDHNSCASCTVKIVPSPPQAGGEAMHRTG